MDLLDNQLLESLKLLVDVLLGCHGFLVLVPLQKLSAHDTTVALDWLIHCTGIIIHIVCNDKSSVTILGLGVGKLCMEFQNLALVVEESLQVLTYRFGDQVETICKTIRFRAKPIVWWNRVLNHFAWGFLDLDHRLVKIVHTLVVLLRKAIGTSQNEHMPGVAVDKLPADQIFCLVKPLTWVEPVLLKLGPFDQAWKRLRVVHRTNLNCVVAEIVAQLVKVLFTVETVRIVPQHMKPKGLFIIFQVFAKGIWLFASCD
mmetsp:Transcript_32515/g.51744  ORF Transcript_32515/g.51744 Transcript_32515/m.51744 type:complete len:258 (-) Transcript_32515:1232-2005(-)